MRKSRHRRHLLETEDEGQRPAKNNSPFSVLLLPYSEHRPCGIDAGYSYTGRLSKHGIGLVASTCAQIENPRGVW